MSRMSRITVWGISSFATLVGAAHSGSPSGSPNTSNGYDLPVGVSELANEIHSVHSKVLWICVAIAVAVFGTMIFSLVKFRRARAPFPTPPWCTARRPRSSGPSSRC